MSPESTETSPEVPEGYGGILADNVTSDEFGNVQSLPAQVPTDDGGGVPMADVGWTYSQDENRRRDALYAYCSLRKEGGVTIPSTTTIDDALTAIAKVEAYLKG